MFDPSINKIQFLNGSSPTSVNNEDIWDALYSALFTLNYGILPSRSNVIDWMRGSNRIRDIKDLNYPTEPIVIVASL